MIVFSGWTTFGLNWCPKKLGSCETASCLTLPHLFLHWQCGTHKTLLFLETCCNLLSCSGWIERSSLFKMAFCAWNDGAALLSEPRTVCVAQWHCWNLRLEAHPPRPHPSGLGRCLHLHCHHSDYWIEASSNSWRVVCAALSTYCFRRCSLDWSIVTFASLAAQAAHSSCHIVGWIRSPGSWIHPLWKSRSYQSISCFADRSRCRRRSPCFGSRSWSSWTNSFFSFVLCTSFGTLSSC